MPKKWGTKRRVMTSFKIGEISGVTRPAQEGAVSTFVKFDSVENDDATGDEVLDFAKVSFGEALNNRLMDQKFCRAFYDAFDGVYERNDAFREALRDGYQSSEETVRQYVESIADLARTAAEAVAGLAKSSNPADACEAALDGAVDEFLEKEFDMKILNKTALKAAVAAFAKDGGTDVVIAAIKQAAKDLNAEDELPETGALAVAKADPSIAAMQKQIAVLSLSGDVKKHYDALGSDAEKDAFLALDDAGKTAAVAKAAEDGDDPVVFTTKSGVEIRKSDGKTALILAKSMDQQADQIGKLMEKVDGNEFEKSAKADYANLPTEGVALILKAIDGESDADKKKKMLEALAAGNKGAAKKFETIGHDNRVSKSGESEIDADSAEGQLDALAKAYQADNEGMSFEKAYDAVLKTPQGEQLYADFMAEQVG